MPEVTEQPAKPIDRRDRRIYVWWGAAFALLALVGAFCWFFVRPYLEVRATVRRIDEQERRALFGGDGISWGEPERRRLIRDEIEALGGPERGAAKCALFVLLPRGLVTPRAQSLAFDILGACGQPAVPHLIGLLSARDASVRWEAAGTLGVMGDLRALEPLAVALRDADPGVRFYAAGALGNMPCPRAAEALIAALGDVSPGVRGEAAESLGKLRDPRAVEPLIAELNDPYFAVRSSTARALGEFECPKVVEPLIAVLQDPDHNVRFSAALALGKLREPRACDSLTTLLTDSNPDVRAAAAEALKKIRSQEAPK